MNISATTELYQYQKKFKWREHQMEDDLKMLKVEYLRNHWSDLPQILNLSLGNHINIRQIEMKTSSDGRRPQNIKSWISQQPLIRSSWNFKLEIGDDIKKIKIFKWWRFQNIKNWISEQPLVRSSSNFKLKLRGPIHKSRSSSNF